MTKPSFDMEAALQALRDGKDLTGKDGILTPLIKQLTEGPKKETTFGFDVTALPIGLGETTSVVAVHLGLKTPGRLAGAGSRGYGPEACYNRALMLAAQMTPTIAAAIHD